ncbi:OmpA family protein [Phreatobacter sp.]|uniref:OmpA family protein n=1 Tax=Phreatobacter sp. TaxID=1966341 RepID=UPI003F6EA62E
MIRAFLGATLFALAATAPATADIAGSADHPLVGRYAGSQIAYYSSNAYDEAWLLTRAMNPDQPKESSPSWLQLEGAVTRIRYTIPEGRSSLEVLRNYEQALRQNGFTTLFACTDTQCLQVPDRSNVYRIGAMVDADNANSMIYFDRARYVLAKRETGDGAVHVVIFVGERQQRATAFVHVVQGKPMETGRIEVKTSDQMGEELDRTGRVDLYSILFDFDRADLKSESDATLEQIARLLATRPQLRLAVIGHTDDQGSAAYNLSLSQRRAEAVVAALVSRHRITADRLAASGEGLQRPVADNGTDEGRARNRRVELVSR